MLLCCFKFLLFLSTEKWRILEFFEKKGIELNIGVGFELMPPPRKKLEDYVYEIVGASGFL